MSMDRTRFGAGILGGILLGLFVVASTGLTTFGLYGGFATPGPAGTSASNPKEIIAQTSTSSASSTNSTAVPGVTFSTATSTNTTTSQTPSNYITDLTSALAPVSAQKSPSRLGNLLAQPALIDVVVLLPILIALLIGVALHRASSVRSRKEDADE